MPGAPAYGRRAPIKNPPRITLSLALCSLAALVGGGPSAAADEIGDLRSQMQELAKRLQDLESKSAAAPPAAPAAASSWAGSFPKSLKIPGTDTSLRIGGYVKLDAIYDFDAAQGDQISPTSIPLSGTAAAKRQGSFRLHARQSRFNIDTRTPTAYGELKTFIEGDFFGTGGNEFASNSSSFRLRHAYGTLGPVLNRLQASAQFLF